MSKKVIQSHPNEITVSGFEPGRLDRFLADQFPDHSRTFFQRLINHRLIQVDGHPASPKNQLKFGQRIKIEWPELKRESLLTPRKIPFPILFEDEHLIVVSKPAGLLSHPTHHFSEELTLIDYLKPRLSSYEWEDQTRPGLVHRLDRDTSGVIVMAKDPSVHASLSKQFAKRAVKKTYIAIVLGRVPSPSGTLEGYLGRDSVHRQRFRIFAVGRWAVTHFEVEKHLGDTATLLNLFPLTGRTHQLRVQLTHFGYPILGDALYQGLDKRFPQIKRQMLHAYKLEFSHPKSHKKIKIKAPIPKDFQEGIKLIRLNNRKSKSNRGK